MKKLLFAVCLIAAFVAQPVLAADNDDACGAVLCLAGAMMSGSAPTQCTSYIRKYFEIVGTSHGSFNPSKTIRYRMNFLNQCGSSDSQTKSNVNNRYGTSSGI